MKILTTQQIRAADAYTIGNEPISSLALMERAASACTKWITEHYNRENSFQVFCGMGNNGGDGLAIARLLHDLNYEVEVFILPYFSKSTTDFNANRSRLKDIRVTDSGELPAATNQAGTVIIDALLGSGISKPVEGKMAEAVNAINSLKRHVIAIDVPSGLMPDIINEDDSGRKACSIVKASVTLTFESPKLSFLLPGNASYVGQLVVLDIGLDKDFIGRQQSTEYFVTVQDIKPIMKPRAVFSHKGMFGHALIVAGSRGKMGAAVLAAQACLRSGAGLLTVHIPKCGYQIIQTALPEAMASVDEMEDEFSGIKNIEKFNAIGIGPGIGQSPGTAKGMKFLIQNCKRPMVLDADALNILAENKTWLSFLPPGCILTPHRGEFERLVGKFGDSRALQLAQREFAHRYRVYLVLKGAFTATATPEGEIYFNSTGNAGMAKAGSGDTLTGIITGLLARGYAPKEAAIFGVYLHGLAGDIAAEEWGQEAMMAGDIANCIGEAFQEIATAEI